VPSARHGIAACIARGGRGAAAASTRRCHGHSGTPLNEALGRSPSMCSRTRTVISLPWLARPDMATDERTGGRTPPGRQCSTARSARAAASRPSCRSRRTACDARNALTQRRIACQADRDLSGVLRRALHGGPTGPRRYQGVSDPLLLAHGPLRGPSQGSLTPCCLTHLVPYVLAQRPTGPPSVVAAHSCTRSCRPPCPRARRRTQSPVVRRNVPWR